MITKIICIRDVKLEAFGQPFTTPSIGTAMRSFEDATKPGGDTDISKHPTDFELYCLGTYNDENAKFEILDQPQYLTKGVSHDAQK